VERKNLRQSRRQRAATPAGPLLVFLGMMINIIKNQVWAPAHQLKAYLNTQRHWHFPRLNVSGGLIFFGVEGHLE
jgi:hypothetical protein